MTTDLQQRLPELIAAAIDWGRQCELEILQKGAPLTADGLRWAREVGVRDPEGVRVLLVPSIPIPDHNELREIAQSSDVIGPNAGGLTIGRGIYLRHDCAADVRLIAHELRHVHQYEILGGIPWFMSIYLPQVLSYGYESAPLERDAQAAEALVTR